VITLESIIMALEKPGELREFFSYFDTVGWAAGRASGL